MAETLPGPSFRHPPPWARLWRGGDLEVAVPAPPERVLAALRKAASPAASSGRSPRRPLDVRVTDGHHLRVRPRPSPLFAMTLVADLQETGSGSVVRGRFKMGGWLRAIVLLELGLGFAALLTELLRMNVERASFHFEVIIFLSPALAVGMCCLAALQERQMVNRLRALLWRAT